MAVDAIGGAIGAAAPAAAAGVSQDDFLRIFLTQLSYQDPLQPVDNREFLAQLAQFSAVEQLRQTQQGIEGLLTMQAAVQAVGLLGKTVQLQGEEGARPLLGRVTTIMFEQGQPRLTVTLGDGSVLADRPLADVQLVR